ncbi:hypothetical protein CerSpe_250990 [Prunus speciosa]
MGGKSVLSSSKILLCWIIPRVNLHTLSFSFSSTFTPIPLKLSSSYALADVAKSNNTLETTADDVEKIGKFFSEPSVFDFFINPTIDLDKKCKALDEIAKSSTLQPHIVNFLNILADAK